MDSYTDDEITFRPDEDNAIINFNNYQVKPIIFNKDIDDLRSIDRLLLANYQHNIYVSFFVALISITLGFISCLPLASYNGNIELQTLFDLISRVVKAGSGGLIFIGCWYNFINNLIILIYECQYNYSSDIFLNETYSNVIKKSLIIFFAAIYAIPYSYNYFIVSNVFIPYISIPLYFLSLLIVFYQRTIQQFQSSSNSSTVNRKRNILLKSIKRTLKKCKEDPYSADKILLLLNNVDEQAKFSLLFAVNQNHIFYKDNKEELTSQYEDDNYDKWESVRTTLLNLFLGVVYVALLITLINQYEYLLVDIFINHNSTNLSNKINLVLWIASWTSIIEAILFILATYNIYHNYLRKLLSLNNYNNCKKQIIMVIIYSPMVAAGVILAMTRLQSSYIAFAKLSTFLLLSKDLGFFLITIGMSLSFLVEMCFMIKTTIYIINNTLRSILISKFFPSCLLNLNCIREQRNLALISLYSKRLAKVIRILSDDGVSLMMKIVLQR